MNIKGVTELRNKDFHPIEVIRMRRYNQISIPLPLVLVIVLKSKKYWLYLCFNQTLNKIGRIDKRANYLGKPISSGIPYISILNVQETMISYSTPNLKKTNLTASYRGCLYTLKMRHLKVKLH
jgi:hypothetical protein